MGRRRDFRTAEQVLADDIKAYHDYYFGGKTQQQIADERGVSRSMIANRLKRLYYRVESECNQAEKRGESLDSIKEKYGLDDYTLKITRVYARNF